MEKKKRSAGTKKRKQPPLPGLEELFIQALDDAAAAYQDVMLERCALSKTEDEAKTLLIERMIEHGKARYKTSDDIIVDLTDKKGVRIKKAKELAETNGEA